MIARTLRTWAVLLATVLVHVGALADDTDLFAAPNSVSPANILVVFDNASSLDASSGGTCSIDPTSGAVSVTATTNTTPLSGNAGGIEQCALYAALNSLPANNSASFNIGVMMFNTNGLHSFNPSTNSFGNCPSYPGGGNTYLGGCLMVPLTPYTPTVKTNLLNWIRQWNAQGSGNYAIKAGGMASGAVMQEAWAYYMGNTGVSGTQYTAPTVGCGQNHVIYIGDAWKNNTTPGDQTGYKGPMQYLTQASSNQSVQKYATPAPNTSQITTAFTSTMKAVFGIGSSQISCTAPGNSSSFTFSGSENAGDWGLNWALYMFTQASIKTTSIGLLGPNCTAEYSTWLEQLANYGGGDFYPTSDYASLQKAFLSAIANIIAVNSVFASVSLPVSVNTQGSYLNQIFVGMFRPDSAFDPLWYGNLKQYQLGVTNAGGLQTVDADGTSAINTNTGFITSCARSYWTPTAVNSYWALAPNGSCLTVANSSASDYPDGNIVEKGAQAYLLRQITPSARSVWTCGSTLASCTSLSGYTSTATYSTSLFGAGLSSTDVSTLVDWSRGLNSQNELSKGTTVMRPSSHGDVMHSRPVALNYGTDSDPKVVVFYGANDGMLHAVNGNQTASITSGGTTFAAGAEMWAFMPPEFYGNVKRIYDNSVPVWYKGTLSLNAQPKPYGMDGAVVGFKGTISGTAKTYIYAAMRRGGRALYAFDVTTPASPTLLWKVGCSSADLTNTDCGSGTSNYSSIGQTWAAPKVFFASGYNSGTTPLLLMGGGYDTCEDSDTGSSGANNSCIGTPKGSLVYIIDGTDGHIVQSFNTVAPFTGGAPRSVVSEPTIVTSSGIASYAYMGDLGGVVYRLDFTSSNVNNWTMTAIAKLGCDSLSPCTANRKFMFQPSVVSTDGVTFDILLGTGDREKPTTQYGASNGVQNYFFMVQDQPSSNSFLNGQCGSGNNFICLSALSPITLTSGSPTATTLATTKGWSLQLTSTEQVVTSAITQFGVTSFSTHQPAQATASCTRSLGTSEVYNISYKDASPANGTSLYSHLSGDGLPPSPVAGNVLINGSSVPFCIGCSADSPLQGKKASQISSVSRAKSRLFWYLEKN